MTVKAQVWNPAKGEPAAGSSPFSFAEVPTTAEIASGVFAPALTPGTNCASAVLVQARYTRIFDVVTMTGEANVESTAGGAMDFRAALPIASAFAADTDGSGLATGDPLTGGNVQATPATDDATIAITDPGNGGTPINVHFTFTYSILAP